MQGLVSYTAVLLRFDYSFLSYETNSRLFQVS